MEEPLGGANYWLLKSDPEEFSIEDLKASPNCTAPWDGVRNYQARNMLRDSIKEGDAVLFYHSRKNPSVVGIARVIRAGYPDHTAWDPSSRHHDPRSTPEKPIWYMVDIRLEEIFEDPIPLASLRNIPELKDMLLLRKGSRLSVQPVTPQEYSVILSLAKGLTRRSSQTVSDGGLGHGE